MADPPRVVIENFQTAGGREPFADWFRALETKTAARVAARLNRLAVGNPGDVVSLKGGLFEMRLDFGPGYRIYFAQAAPNRIVLFCGGEKKSQGTDIKKARGFWAEHRKRRTEK